MTTKIGLTTHRTAGVKSVAEIDPANLFTGGMPRWPLNADVTATGSAQGDAAALSTGLTRVAGANAAKGVILPTPDATLNGGEVVIVKNNANAVLLVYPGTGGTINAISANGSLSMAAFTTATFVNMNRDPTVTAAWYTIPLLPS